MYTYMHVHMHTGVGKSVVADLEHLLDYDHLPRLDELKVRLPVLPPSLVSGGLAVKSAGVCVCRPAPQLKSTPTHPNQPKPTTKNTHRRAPPAWTRSWPSRRSGALGPRPPRPCSSGTASRASGSCGCVFLRFLGGDVFFGGGVCAVLLAPPCCRCCFCFGVGIIMLV